jgi:hypothetical protein
VRVICVWGPFYGARLTECRKVGEMKCAVPEFTWRNRGKTRTISVRIAGVPAKFEPRTPRIGVKILADMPISSVKSHGHTIQ